MRSSLFVWGGDVTQVQIDSTLVTSNSRFFIHSKTAQVVISGSAFIDNSHESFKFDSKHATLAIIGKANVLIQRCNFTNNMNGFAVKLWELNQTLIEDSSFENNFLSVLTNTALTKLSRCNFSKHNARGNVIETWSGTGFKDPVLIIEDSHFFDNIHYVDGVIFTMVKLIVIRSVFRNNTIIETPNTYTLSGAAIYSEVLSHCNHLFRNLTDEYISRYVGPDYDH